MRLLGTEDTRQVSAAVQSPDETLVTEKFTVAWYDSNTGQQVAAGTSVTLPDAFETHECRVTQEGGLLRLYETLAPQTVEPGDIGALVFPMKAYDTVRLSGMVVGAAGAPVQGETIEITQSFGDQSVDLPPLTSNQDGSFLRKYPKSSPAWWSGPTAITSSVGQ